MLRFSSLAVAIFSLLINQNCAPPQTPSSSPQKGLRSDSRDHLEEEEVRRMAVSKGLFDQKRNQKAGGFDNWFVLAKNGQLVVDRTTRLIWQQSGSHYYMNFKDALSYIDSLNNRTFAGFRDWRLPTLEEAMSLLEQNQNKSSLYIDAIFSPKQTSIWTSDKKSAYEGWVVYFSNGYSYPDRLDYGGSYVRAVRRAIILQDR